MSLQIQDQATNGLTVLMLQSISHFEIVVLFLFFKDWWALIHMLEEWMVEIAQLNLMKKRLNPIGSR